MTHPGDPEKSSLADAIEGKWGCGVESSQRGDEDNAPAGWDVLDCLLQIRQLLGSCLDRVEAMFRFVVLSTVCNWNYNGSSDSCGIKIARLLCRRVHLRAMLGHLADTRLRRVQ